MVPLFVCVDFTKSETSHLGRRACTSPEAARLCASSRLPSFVSSFLVSPTEEGCVRPSVYLSFEPWFMNNQAAPFFHNFHLTQQINVRITVSRKIHFMQRIVHLFGPGALGQVLNSPHPVILPLILYENSFDVHVFILL